MTEALTLDRLSKQFGNQTAVDSVSLAVTAGELIVLLGPSGCGKTTTLRMIAGFVPPPPATSGWTAPASRRCRRIAAKWGSCSRATRCFRT